MAILVLRILQPNTLAGLQHAAEELLGVPVSVLTPESLPAKFRDHVLERAQPL